MKITLTEAIKKALHNEKRYNRPYVVTIWKGEYLIMSRELLRKGGDMGLFNVVDMRSWDSTLFEGFGSKSGEEAQEILSKLEHIVMDHFIREREEMEAALAEGGRHDQDLDQIHM